jgi:hypothetical protein
VTAIRWLLATVAASSVVGPPIVSQVAPPHNASLAARLTADSTFRWVTVDAPGVRIHLQEGQPEGGERRTLITLVTETRREVLDRLGLSGTASAAPLANLFFVRSREETRRLTRHPMIGFVQPDEPTGVFAYLPGYRIATLVRHELTHLYAYQMWGATHVGPWLVEGLAVWAAGPCQGFSNDALAAGALADQRLPSLTDLAGRFRQLDETVAMPQAGSVVGFLIEREGLSAVRDRWRRSHHATGHPVGENGASIEAAWLAKLRTVRPASLDLKRLMAEGC